MSKKKSCSDSGPPPSGDSIQINILDEKGIEIVHTKSYGVGIDCHRDFIQVSVIVKGDENKTIEYRHEFNTTLPVLENARDWAISIIRLKSSVSVDVSTDTLHYVIESTSCYHLPVIMVWKGIPSIINPSIAGATKRKTDVLDARMLAIHDLNGIWRESYIPSSDVQQLRLLLAQKQQYSKMATRINNRITNSLLKFGYTISRDGSITKDSINRAILENEISDSPSPDMAYRPPDGIPEDVKGIFKEELELYDDYVQKASEYEKKAVSKAKSMQWETRDGTLPGTEMVRILTTAPYVGEYTAVIWLAFIITPNRFPNSKAVAAYCALDPSLKISAGKVSSTKKRGGNKDLHTILHQAASNLMRVHSEPFGIWGYQLYMQSGKWKKGTNAVARRLSVALYYMQLNGREFSYDGYKSAEPPKVINITILQLSQINTAFKRYITPLGKAGIYNTEILVKAYYECRLKKIQGLGKKFFGLVREFIENQKYYVNALNNPNGGSCIENAEQ